MRYIKQRSTSDCGVACLCMIAWHHGKKLPYTEIYEAIGADKSGSTIYGICEAAKKYQLEPTALQGTADEFIDEVRKGNIQFPVMARIVNQNNQAHFIVITSVSKNKIRVYDPDITIGKVYYPISFFKEIFLGEVIEFKRNADFKKENRYKNPLLYFFKYVSKKKGAILGTLIMSALVSGVGILSSLLLKYLVDGVLQNDNHDAMHSGLEMFALMITGMALLYIVNFAVQLIRGKLSSKLASSINCKMITDVYHKMVELPVKFFSDKETGDLMSRFGDVDKLNDAITSVVLTVGLDLIMFIGSGFMIYRLSPAMFPCALIIIFIYALISICYIKPLERANIRVIGENAEITSYIKETTDGICTLKSCNAVHTVQNKFQLLFEKFQNSVIKAAMKNLRKESLIELFSSIGILMLLWVGAVNVTDGLMTAGTLITVYSMLGYFFTPVENIIELQQLLQEAFIAAERLEDIYDSSAEKNGQNEECTVENGNISFDNVSFSYPNSDLILNKLSFDIPDGSSVALIGASGCGKSTAAKLMTRLCEPESGEIRISNYNIRNFSLDELRSNVVYVPQETVLFSDTIRNNLILGLKGTISDERILNVLELCDCGFLEDKYITLDSVVEEGGSNFSGGQLKRLSLARALLRDPKVIILDETLANLDTESVHRITERINNLPITKIWITHNPDQISGLDQIININTNNISTQHSELSVLKAAAST